MELADNSSFLTEQTMNNPFSFQLIFEKNGDGTVSTHFKGDYKHEGYEGLMHGGILSTLLDTAMAHCLLIKGIEAMTGELNVRFISPVTSNSTLKIKAWVVSSLPPLYHLKSQIEVAGSLVCKAKAKFMEK